MPVQEKKYFPIKTATACQLKWSWSTILLTSGITRSCYRASTSQLTPENFESFHNTPQKIKDRRAMLDGQWPERVSDSTCDYCKEIEESGGTSDRLWHLTVPDMYPEELDHDPTAVVVRPKVVEVFFNNTCQMGCLYCGPVLSSSIDSENRRYHLTQAKDLDIDVLRPLDSRPYKDYLQSFWRWFEKDFQELKRFNVLGGEPFLQKELSKLLDHIDQHPNPNCEFNIVSNLMTDHDVILNHVDRIRQLLARRKLRNFHLLASIDCWGVQQEYVRWGLDLDLWEKNFLYLLQQPWIKLALNQVLMPLTIKTAPDLLVKLREWRSVRHIGFYTGTVSPSPDWMIPKYFGAGVFEEDFRKMLELFPTDTDEDFVQRRYIEGIGRAISAHARDTKKISIMLRYLDEKDRRRGTDWRQIFPWLIEFEELCGIVK